MWFCSTYSKLTCFPPITPHVVLFVWMLSERGLNNKINHLHEKALRIAYKDDVSDFKALLEKDNAVTIHVRNIQLLMTEIFKTQHSLNPTFMKEIFIPKNNQYALRNEQPIKLLRPRTTTFGEKASLFLAESCGMNYL